jgi:hypothetical protein
MAIEECPATRASVHASQPDSPNRDRNVLPEVMSTKGRTPLSLTALWCCFLKVDGFNVSTFGGGRKYPAL